MSKVIYDTEQKDKITIRTAINRGIVKNPKRFILPKNKVLIPSGKTKKLITPFQASKLIKEGKLQINRVIGDFDLTVNNINPVRYISDGKQLIKADIDYEKPKVINNKLGKRQQNKIKKETGIIRYTLTPNDKSDMYALYHFVKDNKIQGEGTIICVQDGYVLFEQEINIVDSYSQWWKNGGVLIGLVNSDHHAWTVITDEKGEPVNYYKLNSDKKYVIKPKSQIGKKNIKTIKSIFNNTQTVFIWVPKVDIDPIHIYQTFRENKNNTCLLDSIERTANNSESKKAYMILNKLERLKEHYKNGVPESHIQYICDELKINIRINDIFNNKYLSYNNNNSLLTVKYINTYLNHVDDNEYISDNKENEILMTDSKEMIKIIKKCITNKEYFYYKGNVKNPSKIYTKNSIYKLDNEVNNIINDFNDDNKLSSYAIDIKEKEKLYNFLKDGVNYNAHCSFKKSYNLDHSQIETSDKYIEYDMKTAYAQYEKSKYYIGFPNMMTPEIQLKNWTVEKCNKYIGYYKIYLRRINDKNKELILSELGFENNKYYTLTSPEISFFSEFCDIDIISGSYSFTPLHLEMSEEMMQKLYVFKYNKKIPVKPYSIWAGKLNSINRYQTLKTHISEELSQVIKSKYKNISTIDTRNIEFNDDEIYANNDMVECSVSNEYKKIYWNGHIGGFITAYTRINVLEQLLKFNHNQIIGYKLDGFIIEKSKNDYKINNNLDGDMWYKPGEKPTKCNFSWGICLYEPCNNISGIFVKKDDEYKEGIFNNRITYLTGAGGCGKSHAILNKLKDTLYLSACWSLCVDKSKEYNIKSLSINKFIGINCESYLLRNKPPTRILIDEITMIDKKYIKQLIKMCPYSQIFIAGDIDEKGYYQCAFKDVNVIKPKRKETIIFKHNYRCKDDELLKRLNDLRQYMKDTNFNNKKIIQFVKDNFNDRKTDEKFLIDTYDYKKDNILVSITNGERSQTDYYTKILKGNKYICKKHSYNDVKLRLNGEQSYLTGDIVYDVEPNKRFIKQDAFTIHGFQGKTIKCPNRLFIDLNNIFCARQLYTALSRVEYLNQIYLLE